MRLITDANIWIDLDNGGLVEAVFLLDFEYATPDVILDELGSDLAERVVDLGVTVLLTEEDGLSTWR